MDTNHWVQTLYGPPQQFLYNGKAQAGHPKNIVKRCHRKTSYDINNTSAQISRKFYIATMHSVQCIVSTKIFFKGIGCLLTYILKQ